MDILILGAGGQLGTDLMRSVPEEHAVRGLTRAELDVCDRDALALQLSERSPELVINAAAYTAVDRAEEESEAAYAVNFHAVKALADLCQADGIRLVHLSTDFVFDGHADSPYPPDARPEPLSVYGKSKLAGESAVLDRMADKALVLRTAWVYASHGRNFALAMLERMRQGMDLRVVADQMGTPTWSRGLASAIWRALELGLTGLHHWTPAGTASWYDFTVAIQEEALALGLLDAPTRITPITTAEYPTPATRPAYGVLDKTATWEALGGVPAHWREHLRGMLGELAGSE